jgi:hypothetical protein
MDRPAGTGKLAAHVDFFRELVTQDPDITLFELRDALADAEGVTVHHSAIAGLLKRLGFTHKKKSLVGTERRRAKVRRQRDDWVRHRSPTIARMPDRVIFLDGKEDQERPPVGRFPDARGEDQSHTPSWLGTVRRAADHGRAIRKLGDANADRRADL